MDSTAGAVIAEELSVKAILLGAHDEVQNQRAGSLGAEAQQLGIMDQPTLLGR